MIRDKSDDKKLFSPPFPSRKLVALKLPQNPDPSEMSHIRPYRFERFGHEPGPLRGSNLLGTVLFLARVVICNPQVANAALDAERPLPEAEATVLIQISCIFSISNGLSKPVS